MEGTLHIDVIQKKAIGPESRPKEGADFYMDSEGSIFGLSHNLHRASARRLLVTYKIAQII